MERFIEETEVLHTTIGELICALVEAAQEVSDNSNEIQLLAFQALKNILDPKKPIRR